MASSRRLHGTQEKLRTPRCAQWDLLERRGIAVASPWHLHWTPWGLLGCHATARTKVRAVARRSHGDLNERRVNAVGSQWQRSNRAVRSPRAPRGHRVHAVGTHMIAARTLPYTTIIREFFFFFFFYLFQIYLYRVNHSVTLFFHGALLQSKIYRYKEHIYTHP